MLRSKTNGPLLAGYEVMKVLGKGSFGVVKLVKKASSPNDLLPCFLGPEKDSMNTVYAMKVIGKVTDDPQHTRRSPTRRTRLSRRC